MNDPELEQLLAAIPEAPDPDVLRELDQGLTAILATMSQYAEMDDQTARAILASLEEEPITEAQGPDVEALLAMIQEPDLEAAQEADLALLEELLAGLKWGQSGGKSGTH